MVNSINYFIFDCCISLFPILDNEISLIEKDLYCKSKCENENDLHLKLINKDHQKGQCRIQLYIEVKLGFDLYINPLFVLDLDLDNKRAKIVSYESTIYPHIKLNVCTEIGGEKYINEVAKKDLESLCYNWLQQLISLKYEPVCKVKAEV